MRFHCVVLIMILAACDQHPNAGEEGYPCADWPAGSPCGDWLRCVNGICEPCGDLDGICCSNIGGTYCNGSVCDDEPDTLGVCQKDCGAIGQECCDGECPGTPLCNSDNVCEGTVSDPCFAGDTLYPVIVITGLCAASEPIPFMTNTPEEAEDCRQQLVDAANPDEEVCAIGQAPDFSAVCDTTQEFGGADLWHCSAEQLTTCQANLCGDGDCNWISGECPP
jgi:hypothetical protein